MVQMKPFTKQKYIHRHRKQTYGYHMEEGEREKLGAWNYQMHITVYKTDKQQGPTP